MIDLSILYKEQALIADFVIGTLCWITWQIKPVSAYRAGCQGSIRPCLAAHTAACTRSETPSLLMMCSM